MSKPEYNLYCLISLWLHSQLQIHSGHQQGTLSPFSMVCSYRFFRKSIAYFEFLLTSFFFTSNSSASITNTSSFPFPLCYFRHRIIQVPIGYVYNGGLFTTFFRLTHLFALGEHPVYSVPVKVNIGSLFSSALPPIKSCIETTLTGNQGITPFSTLW